MWLSGTRLPNINRICFLHWTTNEPFPYEAVSATVESAQTEFVIIIGRYKQHFCVANRADSVTRSSYNLCTTLGFRRWLKCSPACPEYHRRQRPGGDDTWIGLHSCQKKPIVRNFGRGNSFHPPGAYLSCFDKNTSEDAAE